MRLLVVMACVITAACGGPTSAGNDAPHEPAAVAPAKLDGGLELSAAAAQDATVADAPVANPSVAPSPTTVAPLTDPPAQPYLIARILRIVPKGQRTVVIINKGADHGVEAGWRARIIDPSGAPVAGGDFRIDGVQRRDAFGRVTLGPEHLRPYRDVKLTP